MLDSIYLRALEADDYLKTYEWRNDPVYRRGVGAHYRYVNKEIERKWIESVIDKHAKGEEVRLAIIKSGTDEFIGMVSLIDIDFQNRNAQFQWMIGPSTKRGHGYALFAGIKIADYAFRELGLVRVWGAVLEDNRNVMRFADRFEDTIKKEGVLRNAIFKDGQFKNLVILGIIKDEFYTGLEKLKNKLKESGR